jgi:hypothetical protein
MVVARFTVIWFYWNGYRWARLVVLLVSLVALWNLTSWMRVTTFISVVIALQVAMGLFLLYWLNTPPVKTYFAEKPPTLLL